MSPPSASAGPGPSTLAARSAAIASKLPPYRARHLRKDGVGARQVRKATHGETQRRRELPQQPAKQVRPSERLAKPTSEVFKGRPPSRGKKRAREPSPDREDTADDDEDGDAYALGEDADEDDEDDDGGSDSGASSSPAPSSSGSPVGRRRRPAAVRADLRRGTTGVRLKASLRNLVPPPVPRAFADADLATLFDSPADRPGQAGDLLTAEQKAELERAMDPALGMTVLETLAAQRDVYERAYGALHDELVKAQIEESVLNNVKTILIARFFPLLAPSAS
ncbi:uncharacterized protein JCM10292_001031 [Rhodotorula paludigena]|uniref:uncharacterized protein n=1 Tax=Rhodotorula paludigena TaxID=86838 RepID=UPI00317D96E3